MSNCWSTTVTELVSFFKGALTATIPWLEKAHIPWKEPYAYDDWDNIASTLYNNIVCKSLMPEGMDAHPVAQYDLRYTHYRNLSFILIHDADRRLAFIGFKSKVQPLDSIEAAILNEDDDVVDYIRLSSKNVSFSFCRQRNQQHEVLQTIHVIL